MALGDNNVVASTTNSVLARKWLAQKLLALSELQLVLRPLCDEVKLDNGMAKTATFAKVARGFLPLSSLSDGVTPNESAFPAITSISVVVDQFGQYYTISDVAELTTSHPILQIAVERLADVSARLIDSEIGKVMLGGTNVRYAAGRATRGALTSADIMDEFELHKLRTSMATAGAPPRRGALYDLVSTPEVNADIMKTQANFGSWAGSAGRGEGEISQALRDATVGQLLGMNVIQSNFLPFAQLLGNTTVAVSDGQAFGTTAGNKTPTATVTGSGGSLGKNKFFFLVTRKDKLRGYEEAISIAHSLDNTGGATSSKWTFNFASLDAGYVYALYFDTQTGGGDGTVAQLGLVQENIEVGDSVVVTAVATGVAPPAIPPTDGNKVHICFVVAKEAINLVTLQNLIATMTPPGESDSDPLKQRRKVGFKFMNKAGRRDETRLLRWEGESSY